MGLVGFVRNVSHRLAVRFIVEPRTSRTDHVRILGFNLVIPPTVFHPSFYFSSKFLAAFILQLDFSGLDVAEIGCGSGLISLAAASRGAKVSATDINPAAVKAARDNAALNSLAASVSVIESDLFSNLPPGVRFGYIISNPPYYAGLAQDMASRAFQGGEDGEFLHRLLSELDERLKPDGKLLLVSSSDGTFQNLPQMMITAGFVAAVRRRQRRFSEEFSILEITRVK